MERALWKFWWALSCHYYQYLSCICTFLLYTSFHCFCFRFCKYYWSHAVKLSIFDLTTWIFWLTPLCHQNLVHFVKCFSLLSASITRHLSSRTPAYSLKAISPATSRIILAILRSSCVRCHIICILLGMVFSVFLQCLHHYIVDLSIYLSFYLCIYLSMCMCVCTAWINVRIKENNVNVHIFLIWTSKSAS